jgi:hypothetical protein
MNKLTTFTEFVNSSGVTDLHPGSAVESIADVASIALDTAHWFDQRRAEALIAQRVGVHVDLIHRLMAREGKSWRA